MTAAVAAVSAALAGALATLGPAAATASAPITRVVPFRSIAGVRLGETHAAVLDQLGTPYKTITTSGPISVVYWTSPEINVSFAHGKAIAVDGEKAGLRLPDGIGIGSAKTAVLRAFPAARLDRAGAYFVNRGRRSMMFTFARGRLTDITIATGRDTPAPT